MMESPQRRVKRRPPPMPPSSSLTYRQAVASLNRLINYERHPPGRASTRAFHLASFRRFLDRLGRPQRGLRIVHLAGTRGKGTTATLLAEALCHRGLRVGLYRSPHVDDLRERITVDGEWIPKAGFARHATRVLGALRSEPVRVDGSYRTFFEALTAIALLHFAEQEVDWAVIETGLGGRLDATNVVRPELTILTALGMDHAALLGPRPEQIAREKAGIIKRGIPCLIAPQPGDQPRGVMQVVRARARRVGARLSLVNRQVTATIVRRSVGGMTVQLASPGGRGPCTWVRTLPGGEGLASALATVEVALEQMGLKPMRHSRRRERFSWPLPGRLEIAGVRPLRVLDGAHCPLAAKPLAEALRGLGRGPLRVCLAMMADKDHEGFIRALGLGPEDHVATVPLETPRAASSGSLAEAARRACGAEVQAFDRLLPALAWLGSRLPAGTLLVTGSFYHLAAARRLLRRTS